MKDIFYQFFNFSKMKVIAFMLVSFFVVNEMVAQDDTLDNSTEGKRYVCVSLANNIVRCGFLMSDDGREILLETPDLGKVIINKSEVISIADATENSTSSLGIGASRIEKDIRSSDQSPQASRYFFAPSAHPMKVGESYLHFNPGMLNFTGQISKNFMGGLAVSILGPGITAKQTINISENSNMSIGGLGIVSWWDSDVFLFPFVNYTRGNENDNITFSFAALTSPGGSSLQNNPDVRISPMVNLSAVKEINPTTWLITENYFFFNPMFVNERCLLSVGARWYQRPRTIGNALTGYYNTPTGSLKEAGIMLVIADQDIIPIPWLGWTWPL